MQVQDPYIWDVQNDTLASSMSSVDIDGDGEAEDGALGLAITASPPSLFIWNRTNIWTIYFLQHKRFPDQDNFFLLKSSCHQ